MPTLRIAAVLSIAGALLLANLAPARSEPYYRGNLPYHPLPDPYYAYYGAPGLYAGFHGPVEGFPHSYWHHRYHRWTIYVW